MAYQDTLESDRIKEAAKHQRETAVADERQRLQSEKAEDGTRREYIRLAVGI